MFFPRETRQRIGGSTRRGGRAGEEALARGRNIGTIKILDVARLQREEEEKKRKGRKGRARVTAARAGTRRKIE